MVARFKLMGVVESVPESWFLSQIFTVKGDRALKITRSLRLSVTGFGMI